MGKSKSKKKRFGKNLIDEPADTGVPITNLPEKFLLMRVKSGTKIRNVLGHALKEFPNYNNVVWTAAGFGIGKAISCAQIFKKHHGDLHQITKLRYTISEKSKTENEKDTSAETRRVPEIHILLAKEIEDKSELGYQAPNDNGEFSNQEKENSKGSKKRNHPGNASCIDAEEFAAMGLRTGQKRPKKPHQAEAPPKKNKKKENGDR